MYGYILIGFIGIVAGIYIDRKLLRKDDEMDTDDLVKALSTKGYWVRIGPKDERRD